MNIYIVQGLTYYPRVQISAELQAAGHDVLSRTAFTAKPKTEDDVLTYCCEAAASADLVVVEDFGMTYTDCNYGVELGIAFTAGVPVWCIAPEWEPHRTFLSHCVQCWFSGGDELLAALAEWKGWE